MKKVQNTKMKKTNAMRLLDAAQVPYSFHTYDPTVLDGMSVAEFLGQNMHQVFKTLVTVAKSGQHYVFVIPVNHELDLKKAAQAVGEKAIQMIKMKELLPLTGYVHGGCSPLGMKKGLPTIFDIHAQMFETIIFSGGMRGCQIEVSLDGLKQALDFQLADLTVT